MGPDFVQAPREVIGIVGDARDGGLNNDPFPATFVPLAQVRDSYMELNNRFMPLSWVVRTRAAPFSVSVPVRQAFQNAADLPVAHVRSMGFSFQIEMNYRALQAGVKVVEVPIHFSDRYSGSSKITLGIQAEGLWVPFALKFAARHQRRRAIS